MQPWYKTYIGKANIIAVVLITIGIGMLSIFSLMSQPQAEEMRRHLLASYCDRLSTLMTVSIIALSIPVIPNMLYDLIAYKRIRLNRIVAMLLWGLLATFVVALVGTALLLA